MSMHRTARRSIAALAVTLAGVVGAAGIASAENPAPRSAPMTDTAPRPAPMIDTARSRCIDAIDRRVDSLATWSGRIAAMPRLTADQRAELLGDLSSVSGALTSVALPAVQAAADRASLTEACTAVTEDYRVYKVVQPRTRVTANGYRMATAVAGIQAKSAELATAGMDTTAADALLAGATTLIDTAVDSVGGITAEDYNADPSGTEARFAAARADLKAAVDKAREAGGLLKAGATS